MKGRFTAVIIISFALSFSGCISGGNVENWNSITERANAHLSEGNNLNERINEDIESQDYQQALEKIDKAILQYEQGLEEVTLLEDAANDPDKKYLSSYINSWEGHINEMINSLTCLKKLISIEMFNQEFYQISVLHTSAELQMIEAFNYFDMGDYQAAITIAEHSVNKYSSNSNSSVTLYDISLDIGEEYVISYSYYILQLAQMGIDGLTKLIAASNFAISNEMNKSQDQYDLANTYYSEYVDVINVLIGIETYYPNSFPSQGYALSDLKTAYLSLKDEAEGRALTHKEKMEQIEADNAEFFEN